MRERTLQRCSVSEAELSNERKEFFQKDGRLFESHRITYSERNAEFGMYEQKHRGGSYARYAFGLGMFLVDTAENRSLTVWRAAFRDQ